MKKFFASTIKLFCLAACVSLTACSTQNNGEAVTNRSAFAKTIERAKKEKNYFVMYSGKDTFAVTNIIIENRRRELTVQLDRMDSLHRVALNNPTPSSPAQKLFLYMRDSTSYTLDEPHTIPIGKIYKIEFGK